MSIEKKGTDIFSSLERDAESAAVTVPDDSQQSIREDGEQPSFLRLPFFQWKAFFIFLGISLGIVGHWLSTSELFNIPSDIASSRKRFFQAKEGYFSNQIYWDAKQQHFVDYVKQELAHGDEQLLLQRLQETPGEILISFLLQKIYHDIHRIDQVTIFPREGAPCLLVITKPEPGIWPLNIMLSLELEVKIHAHRFSLSISRLRRGAQDVALNLSWAYFGPELKSIRQLETPTKEPLILLSTSDRSPHYSNRFL